MGPTERTVGPPTMHHPRAMAALPWAQATGAQGQRLQPIHIGQTTKLHEPYHEQASAPPVRGRRST